MNRSCWLALLVSGLLGTQLWAREPIAPETLPLPQRKVPQFALQGAGSCSAAACHHADVHGTRGNEYGVALARDPADTRLAFKDRHAQAYQVLLEPRSRAMERKLRGLPDTATVRPQDNVLCLRCHVHPEAELADDSFRREDGVSCEACHGPAERWLGTHFRSGRNQGMTDTRSLTGRVQTCVQCHVGAENMDVNHDLIAAGHPRLRFEFASYHVVLHKHWDHAAEKAQQPNFEAHAWLLGQAHAARAALKLLEHRATDGTRPWPEFAEHDCFACHHDLKEQSWRRDQGLGRKLGSAAWNPWYNSMLPTVLSSLESKSHPERKVGGDLSIVLQEIHAEMERPRPRRTEVASRARQAVLLLDKALSRPASESWADLAGRVTQNRPVRSWDEASQTYFALSALDRARRDARLPATGSLRLLETLLRLPPGFASPRDFEPGRFQEVFRRKGL